MTIRFLHDYTLQRIEELCRDAEAKGQKVRVAFEIYDRLEVAHIQPDLSIIINKEDNMIFMFSHQIHSSKDLFQFDNEDIKILTDKTREELR